MQAPAHPPGSTAHSHTGLLSPAGCLPQVVPPAGQGVGPRRLEARGPQGAPGRLAASQEAPRLLPQGCLRALGTPRPEGCGFPAPEATPLVSSQKHGFTGENASFFLRSRNFHVNAVSSLCFQGRGRCVQVARGGTQRGGPPGTRRGGCRRSLPGPGSRDVPQMLGRTWGRGLWESGRPRSAAPGPAGVGSRSGRSPALLAGTRAWQAAPGPLRQAPPLGCEVLLRSKWRFPFIGSLATPVVAQAPHTGRLSRAPCDRTFLMQQASRARTPGFLPPSPQAPCSGPPTPGTLLRAGGLPGASPLPGVAAVGGWVLSPWAPRPAR